MVRHYHLYGISLRSNAVLSCPPHRDISSVATELLDAPPSVFDQVRGYLCRPHEPGNRFRYVRLPDGGLFLQWSGLFEFVISPDGQRIACQPLTGTSRTSLQTYLLTQVLSFALLQQGIESLHATAIAVDGRAVALVGDSGYGKSSLAAAFLRDGCRLLTDDALVIRFPPSAPPLAQPGPPHIKLLPDMAQKVLGDWAIGAPMNPQTTKLVIPLPKHLSASDAVPLRAIYVLRPPDPRTRQRVTLRRLAGKRAFLDLLANTYNPVIVEPVRLQRQFEWARQLIDTVPIKSLSFPRTLRGLPEVIEALKTDLHR